MEAPLVAVACSGGRDSTALLHATLRSAAEHGWRVLALHVHHGLSEGADAWLRHVERQCAAWAAAGEPVDFLAERLNGSPTAGESTEAWARRGRYQALGRMARSRGASSVLLGHHRRDQAETFLLQALRGGGTAGLSAMPACAVRDGVAWLRPWLARSRQEIDAYASRHGLTWIDDDSNANPRFVRNRLRLDVWPALTLAFPDAEVTLARAAAWAQEAHLALAEMAEIDLTTVQDAAGLALVPWLGLSLPRRSLVLRTWLKRLIGGAADATLTTRLMLELPVHRAGRWPLPRGELRLYRGVLRFVLPAGPDARVPLEPTVCILRAGSYPLPGWSGVLRARRVATGGVPLELLARLDLKPRTGGERFQAAPGRPPRSLKKQFQQAGVAAWERDGPLVYSGGALVFVPGLGIDARALAPPGEPAMALDWLRGRRTVAPPERA